MMIDFFHQNATLIDFKYCHWDCTTQGQRSRYGGVRKHTLLCHGSITDDEWSIVQHDIQGALNNYKLPTVQDGIQAKKNRRNLARTAKQKATRLRLRQKRKLRKAAKQQGLRSADEEESDDPEHSASNQTAKDLVAAINAD